MGTYGKFATERIKIRALPLVSYDFLITFEPFNFTTLIIQLADQCQRFLFYELLGLQHLYKFVWILCVQRDEHVTFHFFRK